MSSESGKALVAYTERGMVPSNIDEAYRMARAIAQSGLAPRDLATPEKILAAMQLGAEVGLSPMASLKSVAVINGRPSLWGDALPALGFQSGLLEDIDEWLEGDGDQAAAVCRIKRRGLPTAKERRFSVADAKRAGLWGKAGPWKQYPARMLQMRARGLAFRDVLPDVLCGAHVAEEAMTMPGGRVETRPAPAPTHDAALDALGIDDDPEAEVAEVVETVDLESPPPEPELAQSDRPKF